MVWLKSQFAWKEESKRNSFFIIYVFYADVGEPWNGAARKTLVTVPCEEHLRFPDLFHIPKLQGQMVFGNIIV